MSLEFSIKEQRTAELRSRKNQRDMCEFSEGCDTGPNPKSTQISSPSRFANFYRADSKKKVMRLASLEHLA